MISRKGPQEHSRNKKQKEEVGKGAKLRASGMAGKPGVVQDLSPRPGVENQKAAEAPVKTCLG